MEIENHDIEVYPLHQAVRNKSINSISFMLNDPDLEPELERQDQHGATPIMVACEHGHLDLCQVLADKGCDINLVDKAGKTCLWWAADKGHLDIVKWLIAKSFNQVNAIDSKFSESALNRACINENWDIVKYLLRSCRKNINVNNPDFDGMTALMYAAENGIVSVVEKLIKMNADIHVKDQDKETAILLASSHGHPKVMDMLVKAGANLNDTCKYGECVVQRAHRSGNAERLSDAVQKHVLNTNL